MAPKSVIRESRRTNISCLDPRQHVMQCGDSPHSALEDWMLHFVVASSHLRHLYPIGPLGQMQGIPHMSHTCTLGLICMHPFTSFRPSLVYILASACLAWMR